MPNFTNRSSAQMNHNLRQVANSMQSALVNGNANLHRQVGKVTEINANRVVTNLKDAFVGEKCILRIPRTGQEFAAQVVAIENGNAILSPFAGVEGLSGNAEVFGTGEAHKIEVGDRLIGKVIDGLGNPLSNQVINNTGMQRVSITAPENDPLDRPVIDTIFETGIKTIDGFNTVGHGQRMAIFGEAGAGKSVLLSMLARHASVDVIVLAMIGERGREVNEFLERQLPEEMRKRCVVVVSTSDRPAMERIMAGHTAMTIAEHFRAKGKNVMMLFDSVTRFARALREVGLSAGEKAVRNGFPPSVYAELPKLVERTGRTSKGSITAFFTVLVENEGINDPVAEELASLTDGHIILDPALAQSGVYPAINLLKSKSRLMNEIVDEGHLSTAIHLKSLQAKYLDIELLVQVGEYARGSDPMADAALDLHQPIRELCKQGTHEAFAMDQTISAMSELIYEQDPANE